jgi:hypothetical protein
MRHYPFILRVAVFSQGGAVLGSAEAAKSTMNRQLPLAIFQEYDPSINWTSFKLIVTTSNQRT